MSSATHLYFDHPHEADPDDRGQYWATDYSDTHKVFNYMPLKLFDNMDYDVDASFKPLRKYSMCKKIKCPTLKKPQNIIGNVNL